MTLQDARGLATSSGKRKSLDAFEVALGQFQCYRGNAVATIYSTDGRNINFNMPIKGIDKALAALGR